jgi:hypothetical protein
MNDLGFCAPGRVGAYHVPTRQFRPAILVLRNRAAGAAEILAQAFFTVMGARKVRNQGRIESAIKLYESIPPGRNIPQAISRLSVCIDY